MKRRSIQYASVRGSVLATLVLALGLPGLAAGGSAIVAPGDGYEASDLLSGEWIDNFCLLDDAVAVFSPQGGLEIVNRQNPALRQSWGKPDDYFAAYTDPGSGYVNVWSSFMTPDPSGSVLWVGFTMSNNTDDRIYQVDASGTWTHRATLAGNFDLEFFGGEAIVSANPGATQMPRLPQNTVYQLDRTGADQHDVLAEVGGYSTGMGVDPEGNLYCATYYLDFDGDGLGPSDNMMYRFTAAQIASAVGPGSLSLADAEPRLAMPAGSADVDVDEVGHVVFADNTGAGASRLVAWREGEGSSVVPIALPAGSGSSWFTAMDVAGDVTAGGGKVCVVDYWKSGIAEIVKLVPGDANGDGLVDEADASLMADHWGNQEGLLRAEGDFDADGMVGPADASILAAHWGQGTSPAEAATVPEPGSLVMLVSLLLTMSTASGVRNKSTQRRKDAKTRGNTGRASGTR